MCTKNENNKWKIIVEAKNSNGKYYMTREWKPKAGNFLGDKFDNIPIDKTC